VKRVAHLESFLRWHCRVSFSQAARAPDPQRQAALAWNSRARTPKPRRLGAHTRRLILQARSLTLTLDCLRRQETTMRPFHSTERHSQSVRSSRSAAESGLGAVQRRQSEGGHPGIHPAGKNQPGNQQLTTLIGMATTAWPNTPRRFHI